MAKLARRIGFNPSTLSNVLTGRTRIGEDLLEALLLYWGTTEENLLDEAREDAPRDPYQNRQIAAAFVKSHLPAKAIDHVLAEQLDLDEDPDPYWWLCRMQAVAALIVGQVGSAALPRKTKPAAR